MIFRALDTNGDFCFGHGKQDYLRRIDAIREDIRTALLEFLNDAFWAPSDGIDWWNLLGGKNPAATTNILLQTRRTILSRYGVVRVDSLNYQMDRTTRALSIQYTVFTIFSGFIEDIIYLDPIGFNDSFGNLLVDSEGNVLNT